MPQGRQGQAVEPTKSAMNQARRLMVGSGAGLVGGRLRLGVGHAIYRPARSLHPGRGGRTRLPPRELLASSSQAQAVLSRSAQLPGGPDELVFCGPGGSNGVPRGARSRLSVGNYRRVYRLAVARAELPELDPHGPHDLRHTFATWLEDGGVPARVIDELMGHQAGRRGEREGSMIGTRYRHMTEAMQARVVAVIAERLAVALAVMPQVCPKPGSGEEAAC
jgi:hypothetical protein